MSSNHQVRSSTSPTSQSNGRNWVEAKKLSEIALGACVVVHLEGHTLAIVRDGERAFAVDNRCPHMGFPLSRGSICDGILTCHWHHARFDLQTGGTFDQWADDVRAFPTEIRDGAVWVDLTPQADPRRHHIERLKVGLERNISLVLGKAVLSLLDAQPHSIEPFCVGLEFGTRYRRAGWGQGLTILTCVQNLLPWLDPGDRPRALFHGLSAVANDCDGEAPRFAIRPLPDKNVNLATLKKWFRQFIEVRDAEGAERCIASAVRAGADGSQMADMLFAAVTDHRFIDIGHPLDFTNKAFEALDVAGWEYAEPALTNLVATYAAAERMEESNEWRHPIDLVALLESAFVELTQALESGRVRADEWRRRAPLSPSPIPMGEGRGEGNSPANFVDDILSDDPERVVTTLLGALRDGCPPVELAGQVVYAAALRIARFPTSNEFRDWDTALHTFTFANAVQQGLRRCHSPELLRGVFDAAMSVYLDRFLNVPAVPIPEPPTAAADPNELLRALSRLLNERHQVNQAAQTVVHYLSSGGDERRLLATLGGLLLREDRDFHTIQMVEGAIRQHQLLEGSPNARRHILTAATRYLAAHAPTMRSQEQTWQIVDRLHHGARLFEGEDGAA
ncbi:MAG TPA: Rieske (2Fe-2S) protein [Planctomycetaceae bacterium]|jgi:nitrite reductase/ring-hydroxylating ferredoxin subunit|nr:Rieske (2Fe-2S) protein [Planctomycetaceae bacterium]